MVQQPQLEARFLAQTNCLIHPFHPSWLHLRPVYIGSSSLPAESCEWAVEPYHLCASSLWSSEHRITKVRSGCAQSSGGQVEGLNSAWGYTDFALLAPNRCSDARFPVNWLTCHWASGSHLRTNKMCTSLVWPHIWFIFYGILRSDLIPTHA